MKKILFIIVIIATSISCNKNDKANTRKSLVDDASKPYVLKLFSIMAPGNGWEITETTENNQYKIEFYHRESETHTIVGYVLSTPINYKINSSLELKRFLNDLWYKQYNDKRYEIIENSIKHNNAEFGGYSFSHKIKYKDFEAPNKMNNNYLLSDGKEHILLHPDDRNIMLCIRYSERGTVNEIAHAQEKAKKFISNFRVIVK